MQTSMVSRASPTDCEAKPHDLKILSTLNAQRPKLNIQRSIQKEIHAPAHDHDRSVGGTMWVAAKVTRS
jgi:hypothetical protein